MVLAGSEAFCPQPLSSQIDLMEAQQMIRVAPASPPGACDRDTDRMERAIELPAPEGEEAAEFREFRSKVEILPDESLQHGRMVGEAVEDFGSRQAPVARVHGSRLRSISGHQAFQPAMDRPFEIKKKY